jgi:glyoxylase-like metal-dependent hydrolase (beta-lactamase superfamily II)/rhodanese-related sulfurtransferase
MIVQQFFVEGLAHSSYLLGGTNTCAIVDPRRDVEIYLNAAKSLDMKITHILETHLHADFVSGHIDLAEKTGAKIYAPKSGECKFNHIGLAEGDRKPLASVSLANTFELEDMVLSVLETPGHTPEVVHEVTTERSEHICYVVTDTARGNDPVGVFTGDTLFVGDVGRPDLFPGKAKKLASSLYDSLHEKLLKLPDFCEVYPAHGAGSLCGRTMGAKRTSTIGYERKYNAALQIKNREEFIKSLTTNMPQAPDHFSRCSDINRNGPTLVRNLPILEELEPETFQNRAQNENTLVLDVRSYDSFGGQHIPGAYHIDLGGNFATFAGWVLPPDAGILLVTDNNEQAKEAVVWLKRVGLDKVIGYLGDGMYAWAEAGLSTSHVGQLSVEELHETTTSEHKMVLVDVRAPSEYEKLP